jgi:hypothetical protein
MKEKKSKKPKDFKYYIAKAMLWIYRMRNKSAPCKTGTGHFPILIVYRISDSGYSKIKPGYITNENCLRNAVCRFPTDSHEWIVIADNVCEDTYNMIRKYIPESQIHKVSVGHGAGTFRIGYKTALEYSDNTIVYFLENDYLHRENASKVLREAINLCKAEYVTLYDHPDKYGKTGNPYVNGGEKTQVFLTDTCHWKITNSTTMTFAAQVKTLKKDRRVFDKWTKGTHPHDFMIFVSLCDKFIGKGRKLISPIPAYSTHGETNYLAPCVDWENENLSTEEIIKS